MLPDIGLIGVSGSGKDTVGRILVEKYGYGRVAFADAVKDLLVELNPWVDVNRLRTYVSLDGFDSIKRDPEIRRLLQALGHGARQIIGPDVWLLPAKDEAWMHAHWHGRPSVFTDVRYENEAALVEETGLLVRIERDGAGLSGELGAHLTETALREMPTHYIIENNGTLDDLADAVDTMMADVKGSCAA